MKTVHWGLGAQGRLGAVDGRPQRVAGGIRALERCAHLQQACT